MALPPQVQAALDAADATLAAANAVPTNPEAIPPIEPPPEPAPAEPTPEPAPAPVEPAPKPQPDPWEARYKTLQGVFNKEVPQLQQQVKTLQGQLDQAIQRLDQATAQAREQQVRQPAPAEAKDVEEFGQDLVSMVSRVAQTAVSRATQAFEDKLNTLANQIVHVSEQLKGTSQTVAATAEQTFFAELTKLVPDWETINGDQAFLQWLGESDPVYGVPRQDALTKAQQQLDAKRVAAVFRAYTGPQQAAPKSGPDPLEKQVSPKSAAAPQPAAPQAQIISAAQVSKFYDDVRRGHYRGKEAEAAQIEQMINAALAEGRVR